MLTDARRAKRFLSVRIVAAGAEVVGAFLSVEELDELALLNRMPRSFLRVIPVAGEEAVQLRYSTVTPA